MRESSFNPLQEGGGGGGDGEGLSGPLDDLLLSYRESFASLGSVAQSVTRRPPSSHSNSSNVLDEVCI